MKLGLKYYILGQHILGKDGSTPPNRSRALAYLLYVRSPTSIRDEAIS